VRPARLLAASDDHRRPFASADQVSVATTRVDLMPTRAWYAPTAALVALL
jgi:hypothetical protein